MAQLHQGLHANLLAARLQHCCRLVCARAEFRLLPAVRVAHSRTVDQLPQWLDSHAVNLRDRRHRRIHRVCTVLQVLQFPGKVTQLFQAALCLCIFGVQLNHTLIGRRCALKISPVEAAGGFKVLDVMILCNTTAKLKCATKWVRINSFEFPTWLLVHSLRVATLVWFRQCNRCLVRSPGPGIIPGRLKR